MKNVSLNFGAIRDTITRISSSELLSESESKTLKSFIKEVKSNPYLTKQHFFFKNIEDAKPFEKERLAERFINQNLKLFSNVTWDKVMESNMKLKQSLIGSEIHVDNFNDKNNIYESIHVLIESITRKGYNSMEKEQNAYENVLSYLTRTADNSGPVALSEEKQDYPDVLSSKFITKIAVSNFNKRFAHLNENERKVLDILLAENNKKVNYLKDLKTELTTKLDECISKSEDDSQSNIFETFKTKVSSLDESKSYELDNFILSCIELKEELDSL